MAEPLGEIAQIIAGQSPPSGTYRDEPVGLPFFQGKTDFGARHPIPTKWCVAPTKIAHAGDILISVRAPVGPTNIADQRCCIGRGLAAIRPGKSVDRDFLLSYLRMAEAEIAATGSGSAFQAITVKQLASIKIPLPSVSEQRRIAAALDAQMAEVARARAATERQVRQIDHCEAARIRDAFGLLPISNEAGERAPNGWEWKLLTDVARLESGHTPSRRHPEWWGGDIPWLALPDIRLLDGKTAYDTEEKTNEEGLANSSARLLPEGTVVLSRTASVGFVSVMGKPMATSQDFVNWVCGPKLRPWFLAYALIATREFLLSLASGAIHKTIYVPTVKALRICVPALSQQDRIVQEIESSRRSVREGTQGRPRPTRRN